MSAPARVVATPPEWTMASWILSDVASAHAGVAEGRIRLGAAAALEQ
jgi:hypothetical protein